eukprot:4853_1
MSVIFNTKKPEISSNEWFKFIQKLDTKLHTDYDSKSIILLSCPTEPNHMKHILSEYMISTNNEESLFCIDIILDFLIFSKKYVSNLLPNKNIKIHYLLKSNCIVIVHIKSLDIFCLPRHLHSKFNIKFMNYSNYSNIIKNTIYLSLQKTFPSTFNIMPQDWTRKHNFFNISEIGYLCNDGIIIRGDVVRQNNNKIFVHFNTGASHFGHKYKWITVPNDRISPPAIKLTTANNNNNDFNPFKPHVHTYTNIHNNHNDNNNALLPPINRNEYYFGNIFEITLPIQIPVNQQEDDDLARAIQNSLTQT